MAISNATIPQRRLALSADLLRRQPDAGELLVHALAQLPDEITLQLPAYFAERGRLELLARAYGIRDRLRFGVVAREDCWIDEMLSRGGTLAEVVTELRNKHQATASLRYDDDVLRGHRVAVVTNIPTHYRIPLFSEIAGRLKRVDCAFRVYFLAKQAFSRPWIMTTPGDFENEFLQGLDLRRDPGRRVVPLDLGRRLRRFAPTQILSGGFSPVVSGRVARFAAANRIPFGLWSGEIRSRPTARNRLRRLQRQRLASQASYAIAYGSTAAAYLRLLRSDLPIVLGRNTTVLPAPRAATDSSPIEVLTIARAEPEKALDIAVRAVRLQSDLSCRLTVIGDGPERARLEKLAADDPRISFLGAVDSDEIARIYSSADVFLFPSRYDVFGLVLVEAMGAGLATITSERPGAVADLCVSGANCLVVRSDDPHLWGSTLRTVVADGALRASLGAAAADSIRSRWTLKHAADAMVAGFRLAVLCGAGN